MLVKIDEIGEFARTLIGLLPSYTDEATILLLQGEMGAGKTTITKEIALKLGIESRVQSPTFVLRRDYDAHHVKFDRLIHIDAYRLDGDEASVLDMHNEVDIGRTLIVMEWGDNVGNIPHDIKVDIQVRGLFERDMQILSGRVENSKSLYEK